MDKYINSYGKPCYKGVTPDTRLVDLVFHTPEYVCEGHSQVALHTNLGSLTVVDKMTGYGYRDVETGYRDINGKFWLASGGCDVRHSGADTIGEAIAWVKINANTCIGIETYTEEEKNRRRNG